MKQLENNPYTYMDTKHQDDRNKAIIARVSDNRLDEEPILKLEDKNRRSYVAFFDFSDIHYAAQDFDYDRANNAFEIASQFFNGIMGIGGDFFDNANKNSKTSIYGARLFPDQAMDGAKVWMQPFKKHLKYVMGGNHCAKWGSRNDEDHGPSKELADYLGLPYAEHALVYTLNLETPGGGAANVKKMTVCEKHVVDNPLAAIMYFLDRGIRPDVVIGEHAHTGDEGMYVIQIPVYDKFGMLKGYENHRIYFMVGKSMQSGNSVYAIENMFPALGTNVKGIMLSWQYNPEYSPNNPEEPMFIPNADPFNVLHEKENKIGLKCQQNLEVYRRSDISEFKKEADEMSFAETSYSVDNFNAITRQHIVDSPRSKKSAVKNCDEEANEYGR